MQFEFQMFYCSFLTIFSFFYLLLYLISYMKDVAIMFIKLTYFWATQVIRSESIDPSPNHVQFHGLTEIYSLHIQCSTCYWLQSKTKTRFCAMRSTFEDINYRLFLPAIFVMWQTEVAKTRDDNPMNLCATLAMASPSGEGVEGEKAQMAGFCCFIVRQFWKHLQVWCNCEVVRDHRLVTTDRCCHTMAAAEDQAGQGLRLCRWRVQSSCFHKCCVYLSLAG